jgi:hypothetical protein
MSHRSLTKDPIESRKVAYQALEESGAAQEAVFEAFQALADQGYDLGSKMTAVLSQRSTIKQSRPKES